MLMISFNDLIHLAIIFYENANIFWTIVTQQIENNLLHNEFPPVRNYWEVTIVDRQWIYSRL